MNITQKLFIMLTGNAGSRGMKYAMHFSAGILLYLIVFKSPLCNPLTQEEQFGFFGGSI